MALDLVKQFSSKYGEFVKSNPLVVSELETGLRWISYLVSGRFQNSHLVSELLYSCSSLLQLSNDVILRRAAAIKISSNVETEYLQLSVSVLEYVQVFCELVAKKSYGDYGKWLIIFVIQTTKAVIRLLLVFKYEQGIQRSVPIPPLDRKAVLQGTLRTNGVADLPDSQPDVSFELSSNATITLKRSKRLMRSLEGAPPRSKRTWFLPTSDPIRRLMEKNKPNPPPTPLFDNQKLGELLHIVRPVAHLGALKLSGQQSWTPYILSLVTDVASLKLLNDPSTVEWNIKERLELGQRAIALLLYLLRSPMFDKYTKLKILRTLRFFSDHIPLVGRLIRPLMDYLPEWQQVYFYAWSG